MLTALINALFTRNMGIRNIYDIWSDRLTINRANLLDNITYLTGPAALQTNVGMYTDPVNTSSTIFSTINDVKTKLYTILYQGA